MSKTKTVTKELAGYAAVDSGQLMVCDPCYLSQWKGNDLSDDYLTRESDDDSDDVEGQFSYEGVVRALVKAPDSTVQLRFDLGHDGVGVGFSSGWGDGNYPVYVYKKDFGGNWAQRITKVEIIFIKDEEEKPICSG